MMKLPILWLGTAYVTVLASSVWAGPAEEAAAVFVRGNALLAKADFEGALKAYGVAAKLDASNAAYRTQYSILRRVITMRESLPKEQHPEKWGSTALALRTYYYSQKLHSEALPLDTELHARLKSTDSAVLLAQTQLALDKNAEAEKLLNGLDGKTVTPRTHALKGIALARLGKVDQAKAIVRRISSASMTDPDTLFDLARLKSLTGDATGAAATLVRCLELTPPSRLETIKSSARESKDLRATIATSDFVGALKTESRIKESKCSGGSGCGACPARAKCSATAR